MSSINTNIGAYSAQQNLRTANAATSSSIGKLSSGNRIQRAADDVAGLSVGTILQTNVSTLRKGLENAGQANSLLQVADGGLKNITNILQRQKALSVSATSGILSSAERGYLNQEFQNLTAEIDRLVDNTKFNSVKLLDGTLTKQANAVTDTKNDAAGTAVVGAAVVATFGGTPTVGQRITVGGVEITFTDQAVGSAAAAGRVVIGATTTATAQNVARFLNQSGDARLANFYFTNTTNTLTVEWGGGLLDGLVNISSAAVGTVTGFTAASTTIANPGVTDIDGLGRARTFVVGDVKGSLLAQGSNNSATTAASAGEAILLNTVDRIGDFTGKVGGDKIGKFEMLYTAADNGVASIKVGDVTYTSAATDWTNTAGTAVQAVVFTGRDSNNVAIGGTFTLNLRANTAALGFNNQGEANEFADQLTQSFADVTFVQNRDIQNFREGAIAANGAGQQVGMIDGMSANLRSDNFENVKIGGVKITAPKAGEADARISLVINGEQYISYAGLGQRINTNTVIGLQNVNNPARGFTFVTSNTALAGQTGIALDLSTQENADAVAIALNRAFGVEDGQSSLNFQIGSASTDAIGVDIAAAGSYDLFNGESLNVLDVSAANNASSVLDEAIARVTSLRANIGALQSRFDFASANLETSIQNVDAARSTFLDANISEESTAFAQAQVKLQASISVLAQANQLPQNLLKLIG